MHSAPAVGYPVGRSCFPGVLALALWLVGLLAVILWIYQGGGHGWRQVLGLGSAGVAGAFALHGWMASPVGELRWSGEHWIWSGTGDPVHGTLNPFLDVQHCLLVRFHGPPGSPRWLWLARASRAERWDDLRRAVYSRASGMAATPASRLL